MNRCQLGLYLWSAAEEALDCTVYQPIGVIVSLNKSLTVGI